MFLQNVPVPEISRFPECLHNRGISHTSVLQPPAAYALRLQPAPGNPEGESGTPVTGGKHLPKGNYGYRFGNKYPDP